MFTIKYTMAEEQRTASVMSQPIFNADLKIDRLSHSSSPVEGGNTIFILCSKVKEPMFWPVLIIRMNNNNNMLLIDPEEDDSTTH